MGQNHVHQLVTSCATNVDNSTHSDVLQGAVPIITRQSVDQAS